MWSTIKVHLLFFRWPFLWLLLCSFLKRKKNLLIHLLQKIHRTMILYSELPLNWICEGLLWITVTPRINYALDPDYAKKVDSFFSSFFIYETNLWLLLECNNKTCCNAEGPGIEQFQIDGEATPGKKLLGCGYPLGGAHLCMFQVIFFFFSLSLYKPWNMFGSYLYNVLTFNILTSCVLVGSSSAGWHQTLY